MAKKVIKSKRRKWIRALWTVVCVELIAVVCLGVYGFDTFAKAWKDPSSQFQANADATPPPLVVTDDAGEVTNEYKYDEDVVGIVLIGVDIIKGRSINEVGYNTDTMMVAAINTKTNEVTLISLPRDTKATFPVLNKSGEQTRTKTGKLNAAFAYGGGPDGHGYENTVSAVNNLLGTSLTYYMAIDMNGVPPIVNAVGGVPITLDADFSAIDPTMTKGKTMTLNGDQALTYCRERKLKGMDGSDISRTGRQRNFVKAFAEVLMTKNPVSYIPQLYGEVQKYTHTNLTLPQITALAKIFSNLDIDNMRLEIAEGSTSNGYWVVDKNKMHDLVAEVFYVE